MKTVSRYNYLTVIIPGATYFLGVAQDPRNYVLKDGDTCGKQIGWIDASEAIRKVIGDETFYDVIDSEDPGTVVTFGDVGGHDLPTRISVKLDPRVLEASLQCMASIFAANDYELIVPDEIDDGRCFKLAFTNVYGETAYHEMSLEELEGFAD